MKQDHKPRIGNVAAGILIGIAFFILDPIQFLITFIPALGWILSMFVGFIAFCFYAAYFFANGVNYFKGKMAGLKIASIFGGFVIEMIPIIDALPMITASVTGVVVASRIEDRMSHKKVTPGKPGKALGRAARGAAAKTNPRRPAGANDNSRMMPGQGPERKAPVRNNVSAMRFMPRRMENFDRKTRPAVEGQEPQAKEAA